MRKILSSIIAALGFSGVQAEEFPPNVELNEQTIEALIDAGSDPRKPHPLEHHFYSFSEDSLDGLLAKGESLGYRPANVGDNVYEGTHYWYADLIKETVLDLRIINNDNSQMLKLASEFNAEYDGWGTPVVE